MKPTAGSLAGDDAVTTPALRNTLPACEACGSPNMRVMRHSDAWGFDVGRCKSCRMVFAIDPPPAEEVEEQYVEGGDPERYVGWFRDDEGFEAGALRHLKEIVPGNPPTLFDVGAGVGDFMMMARDYGFETTGNEINPVAIDFARERNGVEISPLLLHEQPEAIADAMTMWCVLAHVPDPAAFLQDAFNVLRPGGVLCLRTPRYCVIDTGANLLAKASGNRFSHIADIRCSPRHLHVFNQHNLTTLFESLGYVDVDVRAVCHYPLKTDVYLEYANGKRRRGAAVAARGLDKLITKDLFIRNAILAFARRPE